MGLKFCFVFSFLICFSFSMQSQFDSGKKKVKIGFAVDKKSPKKEIVNPQLVIPNSDTPKIKFESQLGKTIDDKLLQGMTTNPKVEAVAKTYEVRNASENYTDKLNNQMKEDGVKPELYNRNIDFGVFNVFTQDISIGARDYGAIDGDLVRIWLNGEIAYTQMYLEANFKNINLHLKKGLNVIEIEALNYGQLSPNTGQFNFFDDNKEHITTQYWDLGIGYRGKIVVNYAESFKKEKQEK